MFERLLPDPLKLDFTRLGWLPLAAIGLGAAAVILAYTVGLRWHHRLPVLRRIILLGLRLSAIACLVFALLNPSWTYREEEESNPLVAVVLDNSRSMARPFAGGAGAGGLSRYAKATAILTDRIEPALASRYRLKVFDIRGEPLDPAHLPQSPDVPASPIVASLAAAQHELAGEPLAGIVLLSDGIETSAGPSASAIRELRVPVYPIEVARPQSAPAGPADLVLQSVATNRTALVGNTVRVTVDVGANGESRSAQVPIAILDAGRVVAASTIQWRPDQPLVRSRLDFVPNRAGNLTYTVQLGKLPGETNLQNNRETFSLAVRAKAIRVLYIDGVLRWEGKFIREALTSDPDISVVHVVRTAPAGLDRGSQGLLLPQVLSKVDMVILGDVEASYFSVQELESLGKWVTEQSGALLLTGGYHSFGPKGFGGSRLAQILPVRFSSSPSPQVEQPFRLSLTPLGEESPIFDLTGNHLHDAAFYHRLPPLAGCSVIAGVKPGGQVLAVNPLVRDPAGGGLLPVMVHQQVGLGRAMVFAVDTTWKWRMVVAGYTGDAAFYPRFWGQLVRWMTGEGKDAPQQFSVLTDRSRYRPGQAVRVQIDLDRGQAAAVRRWRVAALATNDEGWQVRVPLAELSGARYEGTFAVNRPGRWDVTATADPADPAIVAEPAAGKSSPPRPAAQSRVATIQVDQPEVESLDAEPRPRWLAQLAELTGGRRLQTEELGTLADDLGGRPVKTVRAAAVELWCHPALASLFFALVCSEWILRRWKRLA